MNLEHWESYYRGGALVSCPMGLEPGYTGEVRDAWVTFFATLPDGARVLDIGTGNGAVALIAKETAATLGRSFEIHGVDLAQVDPVRHVPNGATLLAGIEFHPGVPAEQLPFEANGFDAVSGQYALEYTQRDRALAEIFRVLKPGGRGQFLLHHRDSVIVRNADESLHHAALVLDDTKVFRLLRRYLEAERDTPKTAVGPWQELVAAGNRLQAEARARCCCRPQWMRCSACSSSAARPACLCCCAQSIKWSRNCGRRSAGCRTSGAPHSPRRSCARS